MRREGNPSALLVGMQTGATTVEISMECPKKIKHETAFYPAISHLGIYLNKPEYMHPVFIVALFTIAKIWK